MEDPHPLAEKGDPARPVLTEQFDAEFARVNTARQASYGHPIVHFELAERLKRALRDAVPPSFPAWALHALQMVLEKVARLASDPRHFDSWLDVAGYARTGVMCVDRETKN